MTRIFMEEIFDKTAPYDETVDVRKIYGVKVLTSKGKKIGRVSGVRVKPDSRTIDGIVIRRGLFRKSIYIGRTYFETLSPAAIILIVEPSVLLKGRKVISFDGKVIGKVKNVIREAKTNEIKSVTAHSFMRGDFTIGREHMRSVAKSIMLKNTYDAPEKHFWRRAK